MKMASGKRLVVTLIEGLFPVSLLALAAHFMELNFDFADLMWPLIYLALVAVIYDVIKIKKSTALISSIAAGMGLLFFIEIFDDLWGMTSAVLIGLLIYFMLYVFFEIFNWFIFTRNHPPQEKMQ